jgi:hypothetical protein
MHVHKWIDRIVYVFIHICGYVPVHVYLKFFNQNTWSNNINSFHYCVQNIFLPTALSCQCFCILIYLVWSISTFRNSFNRFSLKQLTHHLAQRSMVNISWKNILWDKLKTYGTHIWYPHSFMAEISVFCLFIWLTFSMIFFRTLWTMTSLNFGMWQF